MQQHIHKGNNRMSKVVLHWHHRKYYMAGCNIK